MFKELTAINKIELSFYRFLGIHVFQKIILWFEKKRHIRSTQKNENYHPKQIDVFSLNRYIGFALYNAIIHITGLVFVLAYFVLSSVFLLRNIVVDILMITLLILNIYCIILQRFNQLKIQDHCFKYHIKCSNMILPFRDEIIKNIRKCTPIEVADDFELLCRIRNYALGKEDCIITSDDVQSLVRIVSSASVFLDKQQNIRRKTTYNHSFFDERKYIKPLYSRLQKRVYKIQKRIGYSGNMVIDTHYIITNNAECECLYKKLIPTDTAKCMYMVSVLLWDIYQNEFVRMKMNAKEQV